MAVGEFLGITSGDNVFKFLSLLFVGILGYGLIVPSEYQKEYELMYLDFQKELQLLEVDMDESISLINSVKYFKDSIAKNIASAEELALVNTKLSIAQKKIDSVLLSNDKRLIGVAINEQKSKVVKKLADHYADLAVSTKRLSIIGLIVSVGFWIYYYRKQVLKKIEA